MNSSIGLRNRWPSPTPNTSPSWPLYIRRFRFNLGDPTRLRQVLVNLVGNAVKFTEQGEVVIRVEPVPEPEMAGALRVSVSDTGIGIPRDKIAAIFHSFTQGDSSTTRKYGGTGLGLSLSQRLVGMMGSRLTAESILGQAAPFVHPSPVSMPTTESPSAARRSICRAVESSSSTATPSAE